MTANAGSSDASVLLGFGDGTFSALAPLDVGEAPSSVVLGDLNGDGTPDLVTANAGFNDTEDLRDVSVLLGRGNGTFAAEERYGVGIKPVAVALEDLDGDGRLDLATANAGSRFGSASDDVSVLLGRGNGLFG